MGDDLFYLSSTIMLFLVISNSMVAIQYNDPTRDGDRWEAIKMLQL